MFVHTFAGSVASNCCNWLFPLVVEFGGGAYCMQLDPWGDAASPEAAPWAGDMVVAFTVVVLLWWFSVCLLNDLASQYDFPQPSALHSYGFLFLCVNMWPFLQKECTKIDQNKSNLNFYTYRWSCRLNAFPHIVHTYLRSSLCVNLCLANAEALPKILAHTWNKSKTDLQNS